MRSDAEAELLKFSGYNKDYSSDCYVWIEHLSLRGVPRFLRSTFHESRKRFVTSIVFCGSLGAFSPRVTQIRSMCVLWR